jgi:anti-sigma B factor antagonist
VTAATVEADTTGVVTLDVVGELTIQTAAEQKVRLLAALEPADRLRLDLQAVTEVDTAGLQLLLMLRREAVQAGKAVELVGHSQPVLDVFALANRSAQLADLSGTTPITDDGADAATEEPSR